MQSGIVEQRVVLVLDHATLLSDQSGGSETITVNMTLHAGDLALIHVEHLQRALTFADTCSGLVSPAPGKRGTPIPSKQSSPILPGSTSVNLARAGRPLRVEPEQANGPGEMSHGTIDGRSYLSSVSLSIPCVVY